MGRNVFHRFGRSVALSALLACGLGCHSFSKEDAQLLERYGGGYIPSGEGPGHYWTPVAYVYFDADDHVLDDADFAAVFPVVRNMNPYGIHLIGKHAISGRSIGLLNQLPALERIDVSSTPLALDDLRGLRVKNLRTLYVSPNAFSDADVASLRKALPHVVIARFQQSKPSRNSTNPIGKQDDAVGQALAIAIA
jgi:hypothetical protein